MTINKRYSDGIYAIVTTIDINQFIYHVSASYAAFLREGTLCKIRCAVSKNSWTMGEQNNQHICSHYNT